MRAPGRRIPRANLVVLAIFLAVTVPFVCWTLMKPAVIAPFAALLPPQTWRTLRLVTALFFWGTLIYTFTKGRRNPTAPR